MSVVKLNEEMPTSWPFDMTVGAFYQWQLFKSNGYYAIPGLNNIEGYTESGGQETNPAGFGIPVQNGGTMVLGSPAVAQDAFYLVQNNLTDHDEASRFARFTDIICQALDIVIPYYRSNLTPRIVNHRCGLLAS